MVGTLDGFIHKLRLGDGMELPRADVGGMPFGDIVRAGSIVLLLTDTNEINRLTAWTPDFRQRVWVYQAHKPWSTFRPALQDNKALVGYPGRIIVLDLTNGGEVGGCDVDGSPRGLAWHGHTGYVGLLQGGVLRLEMLR